jgi:DNA-binding response OmpR family regulator
MRLLVVEDDPMLGDGLRRAFGGAGYTVDLMQSGEDALAAASVEHYDLMVLDLGLPDLDGMSVLRALRDRRDPTPVIILTANHRPDQKVEGLDAGADDYIAKPFDLEELLARVRANIRGRDRRTNDQLVAGDVQVDLAGRLVLKGGESVAVTKKEYGVLVALMRRMGQFVSKQELEAAIYDGQSGVESNTIETAVYALRRKLGAGLILTARGLGYTIATGR